MVNYMEDNRLRLDKVLRDTLGSKNVYFQPPESIKLSYPAIIYSRSIISNRFADNDIYKQRYEYKVVVVDKNPDSVIVDRVSRLKSCRHTSHYTASGLNHDVFNIIF